LTQGYVAYVDLIDVDLAAFKWCASVDSKTHVYAVRKIPRPGGGRATQRLHRVIASRVEERALSFADKTDHLSHATLDNRRSNLRVVSNAENLQNRKRRERQFDERFARGSLA
jgi:hypothetical protein